MNLLYYVRFYFDFFRLSELLNRIVFLLSHRLRDVTTTVFKRVKRQKHKNV